jgi:predicted nucleic acid-binding protein
LSELICDTTVFQYLHQVGLLNLLPGLGTSVVVPTAVVRELDEGRKRGIDLPAVAGLGWATVQMPRTKPGLPQGSKLGPGESEVLWLAMERANSVAVLDDIRARRVAHQLGVSFTGILGLLLDAKHAGLLHAVAPVLDQLERRNFYLTQRMRAAILRRAGETP